MPAGACLIPLYVVSVEGDHLSSAFLCFASRLALDQWWGPDGSISWTTTTLKNHHTFAEGHAGLRQGCWGRVSRDRPC